MRARCHRMLAILDGAPAGARGQSLVELTLTVPILLVMLMGLVEVGWFANNYMVLLDNVREAGRRGAILDPIVNWLPHQEKRYHAMDCDIQDDYFNPPHISTNEDGSLNLPADWNDLSDYGYSDGTEYSGGFYDNVACLILSNMAPLEFDSTTDDIIISVFSYAVIDPNDSRDKEVRIIGRFPPDTNECSGEPDPFDWRGAGLLDGPDGDAGDPGEFNTNADGTVPYYDATSDEVRGFVMRGNHVTGDDGEGLPCLGSDYSTAEVQEMLNFTNITDSAERAEKIDNMRKFGMVLVEMNWKHHQLFGMPWFNLGPLDDGPYIHVWTFFPVSGAELDLQEAGLDPAYFQ